MFLYVISVYICQTKQSKKINIMKTLIKLVNGKEVARKEYSTLESANNAGNSWKNDCTVDQNIRKERSFIVS